MVASITICIHVISWGHILVCDFPYRLVELTKVKNSDTQYVQYVWVCTASLDNSSEVKYYRYFIQNDFNHPVYLTLKRNILTSTTLLQVHITYFYPLFLGHFCFEYFFCCFFVFCWTVQAILIHSFIIRTPDIYNKVGIYFCLNENRCCICCWSAVKIMQILKQRSSLGKLQTSVSEKR